MNIGFIFRSVTNNLPQGSVVKIFVYSNNTEVKEVNITSPETNTVINIGTIASGGVWEIDFSINIPEGNSIENTSWSATIYLVYTPSNETPPTNPDNGR